MKISLHAYTTDPSLPQKDGCNLAHENFTSLMGKNLDPKLDVSFHDFNRLLEDDTYAAAILKDVDCVISNVGPHAHYYFYLRERHQLKFRIFRDVRTAIWSSYLLQEHLCAPFLRPNDVLMVASHYTRGIYQKFFPHLLNFPTIRCYPLVVGFPDTPPKRPEPSSDRPFVLGYIGRLSEDKNFPDLVTLLIELNQSRHVKLLACGSLHSSSCHPEKICQKLKDELGDGDYFEYLAPRKNGEVWDLFSRFDVFLFPSTSNLETLGRVLVEASFAQTPVVGGDHAAAAELLPKTSLCDVDYISGQYFNTHFDHKMGRISIPQMSDAINNNSLEAPTCHLDFAQHPLKLLRALKMSSRELLELDPLVLKDSQTRLIDSIELQTPKPISLEKATALVSELSVWFLGLQKTSTQEFVELEQQLMQRSLHIDRTKRFFKTARKTSGDFTNIGGIDIELCHIANYYPSFEISQRSEEVVCELSGEHGQV